LFISKAAKGRKRIKSVPDGALLLYGKNPLSFPCKTLLLMKENLLQYIWKFKYFNSNELTGCNGEKIEIIRPGTQNFNQGPDFLNARIRINETLWVGNVEVHINSREWNQHGHHRDEIYTNVILHVVWHFDGEVRDKLGNTLPTLVLEDRVSKTLLERHQILMEKEQKEESRFIPCENLLHPPSWTRSGWRPEKRLVAERLEAKAKKVFEVLEKTSYHWDETMWRMMAANFGAISTGNFLNEVPKRYPKKF